MMPIMTNFALAPGLSVRAGVRSSDGRTETLVDYARKRSRGWCEQAMTLLPWGTVGVLGTLGIWQCKGTDIGLLFVIALLIAKCVVNCYVNRSATLRLGPTGGEYEDGTDNSTKFDIRPCTRAQIYYRWYYCHATKRSAPSRSLGSQIQVYIDSRRTIRFGGWLPFHVQKSMVAVINRHIRGQSVASGDGPCLKKFLLGPFGLFLMFLLAAFLVSLAYSGKRLFMADRNSVKIVRSSWWGMSQDVREFPIEKIMDVELKREDYLVYRGRRLGSKWYTRLRLTLMGMFPRRVLAEYCVGENGGETLKWVKAKILSFKRGCDGTPVCLSESLWTAEVGLGAFFLALLLIVFLESPHDDIGPTERDAEGSSIHNDRNVCDLRSSDYDRDFVEEDCE